MRKSSQCQSKTLIRELTIVKRGLGVFSVGSGGSIISRPSQLDPDVQVSPHPAPDVLSFRVCSCECSRGSFRE